jgi:Ca-activated chloride channel family protein
MSHAATKMNAGSMNNESTGGRLVTADGRTLPLRGASLRADARGGIARVVLEQRFANSFAEPLMVTYLMPLPSDGAVSGYAFTIGDKRIVGEVDRRAEARERFENAIAMGHSAALVEQERSSLFTQEIGNIPPGAEVVAELTIDQKLRWLDEGAWEWRFPTVAMPRYMGAAGRVADLPKVTVDVADGPLPAQARLSLAIRDRVVEGRHAESPSHALSVATDGSIALAAEAARLDRDIVVRWPVAASKPGVTLDVGRPADGKPHAGRAYGLLTLVPPASIGTPPSVARDLCLLIDTSGSMSGEPLAQACRVLEALVDTLGDADSLEMIEFSNAPRRWKKKPERATAKARKEARDWLHALRASGSTEMRDALMEALAPLRVESQRQIVLVSDGAIGFETEIVADILKKLPAASRLHTVGVGSGVNRSLTEPAARAGRGIEVIIGLGEDPERAARRICARTAAPLVVDLVLEGSALVEHAPARLPDLFAGAPALCAVALSPSGGELVARGRTPAGEWIERLSVPPSVAGAGNGAVVALFGREKVEDLEMRLCAGEPAESIDRAVEKVGLEFQIATRVTSWIAVSDEPSVDPKAPTRKQRVPQELPFGVSVDGLGLRGAPSPTTIPMPMQLHQGVMRTRSAAPTGAFAAAPPAAAPKAAGGGGVLGAVKDFFKKESRSQAQDDETESSAMVVGESAARLEPSATVELRGRVTRNKDGELIVEIDVTDGLDWLLEDEAWVDDHEGGSIRATVDRARTTAAGSLTSGQSIRLVLRLQGQPTGTPRRVRMGSMEIVV